MRVRHGVRRQTGVTLDVVADAVVRELLALESFHGEARGVSDPARAGVVHPMPQLQPEQFGLVERPARESPAGVRGHAPPRAAAVVQ